MLQANADAASMPETLPLPISLAAASANAGLSNALGTVFIVPSYYRVPKESNFSFITRARETNTGSTPTQELILHRITFEHPF